MVIVPEREMTIQDVVDKYEATHDIDCIWVKTENGKYVVAKGSSPILRYEADERIDDETEQVIPIVDLYIWIDERYVIRET